MSPLSKLKVGTDSVNAFGCPAGALLPILLRSYEAKCHCTFGTTKYPGPMSPYDTYGLNISRSPSV